MNLRVLIWVVLCVSCPWLSLAQSSSPAMQWSTVNGRPAIANLQPIAPVRSAQVWQLDWATAQQHLQGARVAQMQSIFLPRPDGELAEFIIEPNEVMPPALIDRYPMVRTYQGYSMADPRETVRLTVGSTGAHATIRGPEGEFVVEPYNLSTTDFYHIYRLSDLIVPSTDGFCGMDEEHMLELSEYLEVSQAMSVQRGVQNNSGEDLYTYRIAVSADFGYTDAVSSGAPNVPDGLTAVANTVNAMSGVYEQELAVSFTLIPTQDQLIFLDAASDPFVNNGEPALMINENPAIIDSIIGFANYDIGHVFTRRSSNFGVLGVGYFRSVCANGSGQSLGDPHKANGASGNTQPLIPFFNFLVYHEVGHQFDGTHVFNYCNGPSNTAEPARFEPGSGSTIMSYAGICQFNVQNLADTYLNTGTYEQMFAFTRTATPCAVITQTGNQPPVVTALETELWIPRSTPFELNATGSDPDGDPITYCWEQHDLGPSTPPGAPIGNEVLFRSFAPTTDSFRVFPRMATLLANTSDVYEVLPDYARSMNFRVTARDQRSNGGGVSYAENEFFVDGQSGPFEVVFPNSLTTLTEGDVWDILWDPANTTAAPVNCSEVDIYLSTNNGQSFPLQVADNTPNDGVFTLFVPNLITSTARVKIKAANNVFFDISDEVFGIAPSTTQDFNLLTVDTVFVCPNTDQTIELFSVGQGGLTGTFQISFPAPPGVSVSVSNLTPTIGDTLLITLSGDSVLQPGGSDVNILGISSTGASSFRTIHVVRLSDAPVAPQPDAAAVGTFNQSQSPTLAWQSVATATGYEVQVSSSPDFAPANILASSPNTSATSFMVPGPLVAGQVYYWRVRALTDCGNSPYSTLSAFQVGNCETTMSMDVPLQLPPFGVPIEVSSDLTLNQNGIIADLNVVNLQGTHQAVDELSVSLRKGNGPEILLFSNICGNGDEDFNLGIDLENGASTPPCPPTQGTSITSQGPLDDLYGQQIAGTYTLLIRDNDNFNGGTLNSWGLEVCSEPPEGPTVAIDTLTVPVAQVENVDNSVLVLSNTGISAANLVMTLVQAPQVGTLLLNATPLLPGDSFTQADVNAGLLTYQHTGLTPTLDGFLFSGQNPNGGWTGIQTLPIRITSGVSIQTPDELRWRVYPNPAQTQLSVETKGFSGDIQITLHNAQGQQLHQLKAAGGRTITIPVDQYAAGVYLIQVHVEDQVFSQNVRIE